MSDLHVDAIRRLRDWDDHHVVIWETGRWSHPLLVLYAHEAEALRDKLNEVLQQIEEDRDD